MQRFPFQSWLNYNPLLPASDKWSTPLNSPHHDDFKKVWFVGCLTTARTTPASREGAGGCLSPWDVPCGSPKYVPSVAPRRSHGGPKCLKY